MSTSPSLWKCTGDGKDADADIFGRPLLTVEAAPANGLSERSEDDEYLRWHGCHNGHQGQNQNLVDVAGTMLKNLLPPSSQICTAPFSTPVCKL